MSHLFDYSQLGTTICKTSLFKVHFCREARPFSESRDAAGGCRQGGLQEEAGPCVVGVGGGLPGGESEEGDNRVQHGVLKWVLEQAPYLVGSLPNPNEVWGFVSGSTTELVYCF